MSKKEQILREILNIYKIQAIDLSIMYKIEFGDDVIAEIKRLQDLLEEEEKKDIIKIDLSGCKNWKECEKAIELITSGKVKITVEKL
jgi:hypothetical protein